MRLLEGRAGSKRHDWKGRSRLHKALVMAITSLENFWGNL